MKNKKTDYIIKTEQTRLPIKIKLKIRITLMVENRISKYNDLLYY